MMFCYQCQEAANGGCKIKGVCGKPSDVAISRLNLFRKTAYDMVLLRYELKQFVWVFTCSNQCIDLINNTLAVCCIRYTKPF